MHFERYGSTIEGLDDVEQRNRELGFVALQRANHVPARFVFRCCGLAQQGGESGLFFGRFLDVVLTQATQSVLQRHCDDFRSLNLRGAE